MTNMFMLLIRDNQNIFLNYSKLLSILTYQKKNLTILVMAQLMEKTENPLKQEKVEFIN